MSNIYVRNLHDGYRIFNGMHDGISDRMIMATDILSHKIEAAKLKKLEEQKRQETCVEAPFIYNKKE
ncbi:hypothetical protein PV-S19_0311 [Pacmanvirus S19]|nr:hypothetical protein PV-S19_0311 [Pacmanvirus S19]